MVRLVFLQNVWLLSKAYFSFSYRFRMWVKSQRQKCFLYFVKKLRFVFCLTTVVVSHDPIVYFLQSRPFSELKKGPKPNFLALNPNTDHSI